MTLNATKRSDSGKCTPVI